MKKLQLSILLSMLCLTACHTHFAHHYKTSNYLPIQNIATTHKRKPMELVTIEMPHHDVLRTRAKEIKFPINSTTQQFIQDLREFFYALKSPLGKPAGLAAPQVGLSARIIIIQIPAEAKKIRKDVYDILPPTVWINPSYTPLDNDDTNKDWEGCYSVSNKMGEVYRYKTIKYEAYTPEGNKVTGIAKGFLARLIQHEVGHLNGELYIDRLCSDCRYGALDKMMEIRKSEMEQSKSR